MWAKRAWHGDAHDYHGFPVREEESTPRGERCFFLFRSSLNAGTQLKKSKPSSDGVDTIRRWIHRKLMAAFVLPSLENRRKRKYQCLRIQGCEIIRFVKAHLTSSKP